jgi:hypothetical protein
VLCKRENVIRVVKKEEFLVVRFVHLQTISYVKDATINFLAHIVRYAELSQNLDNLIHNFSN